MIEDCDAQSKEICFVYQICGWDEWREMVSTIDRSETKTRLYKASHVDFIFKSSRMTSSERIKEEDVH